ncbi:histidine kinase [Paraprevotella clara]|uniref:histidine kinase n=1 Tax=Paraprevotella clara TaxID=454154 RepID=UPI003FEF7F66
MTLKCVIIDDEPLALELMESYVRKTPFLELCGKYNSAVMALNDINFRNIDLLFLDIQMPDLNGLELSRMLPQDTRIVFTTAFDQYALDGFKVNALDYLLKPINYNEFLTAMAMVFYLNYIWLVPQLLFNKRNKAYVLSNVAFCIGMLFFTHLWFELVNAYFHSTPPPPKNSMGFWGFLLFRLRDFILFGLIAALAATIRMSKKWHEAELGRQKAELKRIEAELKNLHNQINPHFLLNTLNNIYALIAFDTDKAQQAVQDLSRLLRHLLYDNNQDFIPLNRELEFLKNYVALMKIRLSSNVDLQFHIDIPSENPIRVAPLIFISLFENAFKHGISPVKPSFIHIKIYSSGPDTLSCSIENSYFPKQRNDISGSGIGLEQVQKRLDLIYPDKYEWTKGCDENATVYKSILTIHTTTK